VGDLHLLIFWELPTNEYSVEVDPGLMAFLSPILTLRGGHLSMKPPVEKCCNIRQATIPTHKYEYTRESATKM